MAITVIEDCTQKIPNRYKLIKVAVSRARQISEEQGGSYGNMNQDKPTTQALDEIAEGKTTEDSISKEALLDQQHQ